MAGSRGFGLSMEAVSHQLEQLQAETDWQRDVSSASMSRCRYAHHGYESSAHWGMLGCNPRRLRSFVSVFQYNPKSLAGCGIAQYSIFVVKGWWSLKVAIRKREINVDVHGLGFSPWKDRCIRVELYSLMSRLLTLLLASTCALAHRGMN